MDVLTALTSSKPATKPAGGSAPVTTAFEPEAAPDSARKETTSTGSSTSPTGGHLSPETLSAVLAAMGLGTTSASATPVAANSKADPLKDLLAELDANGDGQVSLDEFKQGLGAGGSNTEQAAAVFGKLDADADGAVSLDELSAALKPKPHHDHAEGNASGGGSDPLLQALAGASSTSTTNSDGSVTTSLTYADGSKVTMTMTSAAAASASATSSYNFVEQLIQSQANAVAKSSGSSVSLNA
jgi:Ca2+-binding EF-hand superfamily protein